MEWMKEIDSKPINNVYGILKQSYSNFFRQIKNNKTGKFINPPKFKTRKSTNSLTFQADVSLKPRFKGGNFYITKKLGLIEGSYHRFCEGVIKRVTVRRTPTNKWFMSILVDKKQVKKNNNGKVIGIDWNCRDDSFLTYSDGTRTKCPRFLRNKEKKLSY
jgi:putative transposase